MEQKMEFVNMALNSELSMNELCDRFGISRPTGYKWLKRYREEGLDGLYERSRRPLRSPARTAEPIERLIVELRKDDPAWGARKLHRILERGIESGRYHIDRLPCPSTVHRILKRKGLVEKHKSDRATVHQRFERDMPNELWQMDFKGYFRTLGGQRCDPLTVTDDHSRYNLVLEACADQKTVTVSGLLRNSFRRYGMPLAILCDNGAPWGSMAMRSKYGERSYRFIEKWLMTLNVRVIHGRPYHSANTGKRGKVP